MNILVLNLTRFGDLLQSQATISDFVRQGHKVGLVCLENFSGAASSVSGLSYVKALSGSSLLAALAKTKVPDQQSGTAPEGWQEALAYLATWRDEIIEEFAPELICNLTSATATRILGRFLAGERDFCGFAVDEQGFNADKTPWAGFMQAASGERGVSPFNIVDTFRKVAESCPPEAWEPGNTALKKPAEANAQSAGEMLKQAAPEGCLGFVALQLGASEERRRWPLEYFAAVGDFLWREKKLCPVILGSKAEMPLAERYAQTAQEPHISLAGKTSIEELAAVLTQARLLVTNDTGTMHLGAGLDCPVLAIFLATAQPFDTGPYQRGACSLEPAVDCHPCGFGTACPNDHMCRRAISPEQVCALAASFLENGAWSASAGGDVLEKAAHPLGSCADAGPKASCADAGPQVSGARVWISDFDDDGFLGLRSLSGHEEEARSQWLFFLRHYLCRFIDAIHAPNMSLPPYPGLMRFPAAAKKEILEAISTAQSLAELFFQQGKVLEVNPAPLMQSRFLASCGKVAHVLRSTPYCLALAVLWSQQAQAQGKNLADVLLATQNFIHLFSQMRTDIERADEVL